jgi:hypothetical protein
MVTSQWRAFRIGRGQETPQDEFFGWHMRVPPQQRWVAGSQHDPPVQQMKDGGQHWSGPFAHGTRPGGQLVAVHLPLMHFWLNAQQTPLQHGAKPQKVLPQGLSPHWRVALLQAEPFRQHWLPQMIPPSQQMVPLLMQLLADEQQPVPQATCPGAQQMLLALSAQCCEPAQQV